MKKEKDKDLDDLFKKKLEDPDYYAGYREEDWGALEKMLDKKRRGVIYWLPVLGSVAALLLLFFGWWLFQSKPVQNTAGKGQPIAKHAPKLNDTGSGSSINQQQAVNTKHLKDTIGAPAKDQIALKRAKPVFSSGGKHRNHIDNGSVQDEPVLASRNIANKKDKKDNTENSSEQITGRASTETLAAVNHFNVTSEGEINAGAVASVNLSRPDAPGSKNGKAKLQALRAFHPQYAITVLAAPDINGVGSFQQGKAGTNVGLLFSAELFHKITFSTGAVYASKGYNIAFQNYHTAYNFKVAPSSVTADCKMFDVPLDIAYRFYNKNRNKLSVGTGLSSYIMLNESYKYNYANPYTYGPTSYKVPNSGGYYFGILNLNATYQRQLNSKVGITVEPYLKLPLTTVGYSQVKLQSTGVAVGLTWNLNSLTKP